MCGEKSTKKKKVREKRYGGKKVRKKKYTGKKMKKVRKKKVRGELKGT